MKEKNPIPKVEIFPGVFTDPKITYLTDIDGEKILNNIQKKLEKQLELDYMDAYYLALLPFFHHEKSRKEMLRYMCNFINKIEISEELKYSIKLCQILSVKALFTDYEQEKYLGVIKMSGTYIDNYEKNLIKNATKEATEKIAHKLKAAGVDSKIILECTGLKL